MSRTENGRVTPRDSDTGAALILVVGVGAVLAMLMSLLVVVSVNGTRQARSDSDWNAALAAAYAGIDDYQSRLSADPTYYRFGDRSAPFSTTSNLSAPITPNPAFGLGTTGTWANVEGSSGRAQFRYEVDSSKYSTSGRIRVRSTGKVGEETRSIIADLKQQGFIDFLYFTDYEASDPDIAGTSDASCFITDSSGTRLRYSWESRPIRSDNRCKEIAFGAGDTLNGPVHSNDTIRGCGATFTGVVTTGDTRSPYFKTMDASGGTSRCATMNFTVPGSPSYNGTTGIPPTNSELKRETRTDLSTDVPRPGCLYTGPTQFTFFANGTVNIKSPFTKMTRIGDAESSTGTAPAECGAIAQLRSSAGATIAVPENNVFYVQNVPVITTDVNYWASSPNPTEFVCTSTGTASARGWSFGKDAALVGYPRKTGNTSTTEVAPNGTSYGCRSGDVFVKGVFNGASTIAAENVIYIVGDLTYADPADDILGLVGNNAIYIYNPVNSSGDNIQGNLPSTAKNRSVQAAILSVAHTFQVQNYNLGGERGTLNVLGAIAQKYRGPVGTGSTTSISTGYAKNYVYDERFKLKAPPKFLNPVTTTYGVTTWVETTAAFAANGAAR